MPNTKTMAGEMFPAELASEMFNKVNGHSTLAKLSAQQPIPFNGETVFVFNAAERHLSLAKVLTSRQVTRL